MQYETIDLKTAGTAEQLFDNYDKSNTLAKHHHVFIQCWTFHCKIWPFCHCGLISYKIKSEKVVHTDFFNQWLDAQLGLTGDGACHPKRTSEKTDEG